MNINYALLVALIALAIWLIFDGARVKTISWTVFQCALLAFMIDVLANRSFHL